MVDVSTEVPDAPTRDAVIALADRIEVEDGAPPLSDQSRTQLRAPGLDHFVARQDGTVVGYAQRDARSAELAAEPDALDPLIRAIATPGLQIWSHGKRSRLQPLLRASGFHSFRELYQLRRDLTELPPDPPLAAGITVRSFEPGRDDDAWLAVNAAAFATHAEQGRWTRDDLAARMAEPWFDVAGFLLAERERRLLGFHWTKVHTDGAGEVYVLGVAPEAQGLGLGKALLVRGLHYLAGRGCRTVLLYVDGDNPDARTLYERAGFTEYDVDVQWALP